MVKITNSWGDLLGNKKAKQPIKLWQLIMISPIIMVLFGFGVWSLITTTNLIENGTIVSGEITDVFVDRDSDGTDYSPIFTFTTPAGETYTKTSNFSSSSRPEIGKTVEIIYLPDEPQKSARINDLLELWFLPFLLLSLATIVEMTLIINYLMGRDKAAQEETARRTGQPVEEGVNVFNSATVRSRYWQTVNDNGQRMLEVQYTYQGQTYKIRSKPLSEKQLRKLVPGAEITLEVDKENPSQAIVVI